MRIRPWIINIVEILLIGISGFCGIISLTSSNFYTWLYGQLSSSHPNVAFCIPVIAGGIIFLFGILSIVIRRKGGGRFTWIVIVFSLPSILSFNTLSIMSIFGLNIKVATTLSFNQMLLLSIVIMTCFLLISFMRLLKQSRRSLTIRGANNEDVEYVNTQGHILLLLATTVALITGTIIAVLSGLLEYQIFSYLSYVPWNVIVVSLGCVLILAIYIYWLGSRRNDIP